MKKSEAENLQAWDQYQHSKIGNNVEERIELFELKNYSNPDWTLLDTGANNGKFTAQLAHLFKHCVGLEPYAQPVTQPENVTWVSKGFKEFCESNKEQFDVVYSFAMTIQVEDIDGIDTDEIARNYHSLTRSGGILIYETQKLSKARHAAHAQRMLLSFKKYFGEEFRVGKGRLRDRRTVHFFKK